MAGTRTCPKCGGRMGEGFQLELRDGNQKVVTEWVEGPPERGWFGLVKVRGKRKLEVETWRCERCAYLESYASE